MQPKTTLGKRLQLIGLVFNVIVNKPYDRLKSIINTAPKNSRETLYFFYDLDVEPITYNFCWALAIAEAKRKRLGLKYLKVIIVPGSNNGLRQEAPDYQACINDDARRWRIHHIILPTPSLLTNPTSIYFCHSRDEALLLMTKQAKAIYPDHYSATFPTTHLAADALSYGKEFMCFCARPQALAYVCKWLKQYASNRKTIVITLRQFDYSPERNSNIAAWATFAENLDKTKFFVVIVPDTEKATEPTAAALAPLSHFAPASWNISLRMALYELAYLNLGVNNGPMSLCYLNKKCRYISFKMVSNDPSSPASLENMQKDGFIPGQAPHFSNQFQHWVWGDDSVNAITTAFNNMHHLIESQSTTATLEEIY